MSILQVPHFRLQMVLRLRVPVQMPHVRLQMVLRLQMPGLLPQLQQLQLVPQVLQVRVFRRFQVPFARVLQGGSQVV